MPRPRDFASFIAAAALASVSITTSEALAQSIPPDGLYRVDIVNATDTEMTSTTHTLDGANGDLTVQNSDALHGRAPARTYRGETPVTQCVRRGKPPKPPAGACVAYGDGKDRASARCDGMTLTQAWRKIDDTTWEISTLITQDMAGPGNSPAAARPAIEMAAANGTPEQRAETRAYLKRLPEQQREYQEAMAQVRAAMEADLRDASPEEAAAIRQAQAAMAGGTSATQVRNHIVQRYTRIADRCPSDS